jgi:protein-disulfide isomerase
MNSEVKSVVIIVIITAIIIVLGLSLTKNSGQPTTVTPIADILFSTTTPMIMGLKTPAAQRVSIVEFGDFACPACAMLSPNIKKLLTEFDGSIDFGFRIIPIHGEISRSSAIAAFAAGKQGRFFEMSTLLFEKQDEWTKPGANTAELFLGYAKEAGVENLELYKTDVASETFKKVINQMIDRDSQHATQMKIQSTPTLIINGTEVFAGVGTYEGLKKIVEAALDKNKNATTTQATVMPGTIATSTVPASQN